VFKADFPDDQIEDDHDIVRFGGRNVALAIGEILRGLGCEVAEPNYAGEHGWDFAARHGHQRFWCQVTSFHPTFFLLFEDDPAIQASTGHAGFAEKLNLALANDGRFHDVLWYSRRHGPPDEPDGAGTPSPLAESDDQVAIKARPKGWDGESRAWALRFALMIVGLIMAFELLLLLVDWWLY